ncbi:hypothetical protein PIB30_019552, partial [Stylosanthes scabra]|nr:hypothetical protein [Stylosanthes scabra]
MGLKRLQGNTNLHGPHGKRVTIMDAGHSKNRYRVLLLWPRLVFPRRRRHQRRPHHASDAALCRCRILRQTPTVVRTCNSETVLRGRLCVMANVPFFCTALPLFLAAAPTCNNVAPLLRRLREQIPVLTPS